MISKRTREASHLLAWLAAGALSCSVATGQNAAPPSIKEQLEAQYKLVKTGGANGPIVEPGTVLVIQKGGIFGVPSSSFVICPSKYQDSDLHMPSRFCTGAVKGGSYFQTGQKLYPLKIDVNLKKDSVALRLTACDSCNGTDPPTSFKGEVVFQFEKGFLDKGDVSKIEDTIGEVFTIDNSGNAQGGQGQAQGGQDQSQAQAPAQPAPPAQPVTIQVGMTPEQVEAALGPPDKKVDLGAKKIYVYKDLKVTFMNGKVSDVQ